jgi:hypothetical protein
MLDAHVRVEEPDDDWVDPVDYWWATGEGWENIPPAQQRAISGRISGTVKEAVLKEHPGHSTGTSQNVHGRRGGAGGGVSATPVAKHGMRRIRPGGAGVFGREAPGWQDNARRGKTVRVFGTSTEKAMAEGAVSDLQENGGGSTWSGTAQIGGHLCYVKPENGYSDFTTDNDGNVAPRIDDAGDAVIPAGTEPERELAAHYLDKALGGAGVGAPPVVVRTGIGDVTGQREPSMDSFSTDATTRWTVTEDAGAHIKAVGGKVTPFLVNPGALPAAEQRKLALFDSLIGNTDRHEDNYIGWEDKQGGMHITPIDHGLSFPRRAGWGNHDFQQGSMRLSKTEKAAVANLVKHRGKVRRDLTAILKDPEAVEGFFHRLDFVHRTGRTIDVYDINKVSSSTSSQAYRNSHPGSKTGEWAFLSEIGA